MRPVEILKPRGHNILWQLVPVRDYANAERMLAGTGFTLTLVNLESMTSGEGSKNCVALKVEKAMHYGVHTAKADTDSSTN